MSIKVDTVRLPAFLASALVNGDTSGLECSCGVEPKVTHERNRDPNAAHTGDCDFRWLAAALAYVAPGDVVSNACSCGRQSSYDDGEECSPGCGEPYFARWCGLPGWHLGADMLDYVILYLETP